MSGNSHYTFVVEHLDPELGPWSTLEYAAIAAESYQSHVNFCLSSVPTSLAMPKELQNVPSLRVENRNVEDIYHDQKGRVCLLDPAAMQELGPDDGDKFDVFLFGGILGDDPPRDRTKELRKRGFTGRRLGPVQMTTDTAVRVTRTVIMQRVALSEIQYVDHPELKIDDHESTQMPFRYVKDANGQPVMPEGMMDLIKEDSNKGFEDLV